MRQSHSLGQLSLQNDELLTEGESLRRKPGSRPDKRPKATQPPHEQSDHRARNHLALFTRMESSTATQDARVLELGCGLGILWLSNRERIPAGWRIVLSDLSLGMMGETRLNLTGVAHTFSFVQADAQAIPLRDAGFDAVIANHMLYHVPDLGRALTEIRRVLKPGASLYASTVSRNHMKELDAIVATWHPQWGGARMTEVADASGSRRAKGRCAASSIR